MSTPALPTDHHRARQRRAVSLRCQLMSESFEGSAPHQTSDLSASGAFVESDLALHVGESVVVAVTPPGLTYPLYLRGSVRRVRLARRQSDAFRSGMAIAFEGVSALDARLLERSLASQPLPALGVRRPSAMPAAASKSPEGFLAKIVAGLRARRAEKVAVGALPPVGTERRVEA
jgi:hypothetical protein